MSYQRFKKGGRIAKSPFLEKKSVQKLLNKKIKTDFFFKKQVFLITDNSLIRVCILYFIGVYSCMWRRIHKV